MNKTTSDPVRMKSMFLVISLALFTPQVFGQAMPVGRIIIVSTSSLKKETRPEAFQAYVKEIAPAVSKVRPAIRLQLFEADRGDRKGELLLVCGAATAAERKALASGSPFTDQSMPADKNKMRASNFLANTGAYTEYQLIGADQFGALPLAGILGIHYIKVKPEKAEAFEKFVIEKLHPAVGHLFPDMQMLYYKAVSGQHAGTYITIFTIESVMARDKYWPGGAAETEILKKGFKPLSNLAVELSSYLVEDSYLKPESGGAAAYFESLEWTDFVLKN